MSEIILKRKALYNLTNDEFFMLVDLGKEKFKKKIEQGISIRIVSDKQSPLEIEILGVAGEYVASKLLGIYLDPSDVCNTEDFDLVYKNYTIDVKSTAVRSPSLFIPKIKLERRNKPADYFFLIQKLSDLSYMFCGAMKSAELIQECNLTTMRGSDKIVYKKSYGSLKDFICDTSDRETF